MKYASNTEVSSDKSRNEIEKTLIRYGASEFMYGWQQEEAVVGFKMRGRLIRFFLPMPSRDDFAITPTGRSRCESGVVQAWEQAGRQRWRALALCIKAKLEAVESGIAEFDAEFMAHIVLPNGRTVGEWVCPQLDAACSSKSMPKMLPMLAGSENQR